MLFGLMTGLARSASATEGSNVNVLMLKLILNNIQQSSSPEALTVLVTPWRSISPPRASTVNCQTCLETQDPIIAWRR